MGLAYASTMRAMVFDAVGTPLRLAELPRPQPGPGQVLVEVAACGVCRTDLHVVDGELAHPKLPLVPGHEVVGAIVETGRGVERFRVGQRVGVPWLGATCGACRYCREGRENLCEGARFTGYDIDGGYGEYLVADQRYALPLADGLSDLEAAPLLCAGLIGYRALRKVGDAGDGGGSTDSAPPPTSSPRWRASRAARYSPSPAPAIARPRRSRASSARYGRAIPMPRRRSRWMPRSCSRRWGRWCRRACARWRRGDGWCAPAST